MSKLVYICTKNPRNLPQIKSKLEAIASKIMPDNIIPAPPQIVEFGNIIFGIYNPLPTTRIKGGSICLGNIFEENSWDLINQKPPDGSYVIFRGNKDYVQIISDVVASRTVWYFKNNELFIASTSQRAITIILGSFEFNQKTIPWVLTTGSLGPDQGWDQRVERLGADSTLTLTRGAWTITEKSQDVKFTPLQVSDQEHENNLRTALDESFDHINLDYSQWVLLLSGGFDSRSVLSLLKDRTGLKSITWGVKSALDENLSDAVIAKELAQRYQIPNEYFETDISNEPIGKIFDRFLVCGEGRIDHISGYMDGFNIWKKLYNNGVRGIIRGDEGFGWVPVVSPLDVRLSIGIPLWSDFSNLRGMADFGFSKQEMPEYLLQIPGESLEGWRDRLYHQFRIPLVLGALSDLKLPYVEIVNPLLSRKIIYTVRSLPDHLRTGKTLYKKIVQSISPQINFAKHQAVADKGSILSKRRVFEFLKEELGSSYTNAILPKEFTKYITSNATNEGESERDDIKGGIKDLIKPLLPKWVKAKIKSSIAKPKIDFNILVFRAFIICRMSTVLNNDAIDKG